ncbi:hypothetical protein Tco_0607861 [Tanacetum coccineum]
MMILKFVDTHNMVVFLPKPTESDGFEQIFWSTVVAKTINGEEQLHALVDGKKIIITESSIRRDLQLADEEDEAVYKGWVTVWFESVSKHSNDSLLARGNTLRSDKDRLKLDELMALCTTLKNWVLDLEKTNTTQHNEIASLKRRAKKLEKKDRSRTHKLKRLYKVGLTARVESSDNEESLGEDASKQGRIDAIDVDEEITLVSVHDVNVSANEEVFIEEQEVADEMEVVEEAVEVINTAKLIINAAQDSVAGDIVSAASATTTTATINTIDDITLAQALEEIKSIKPKKKGDKGKGILIKPVKSMKKKDQISLDEETALNLQAEFDEKERLAREKAEKEKEVNIALIETWDDIQNRVGRRQRKKRAGTELIQEITKKQKVEDDKEIAELKQLMKIIPDEEEVAIDAIHLAVKSPMIFDWKIYKEGRKIDYQIIRADG